jgi:signal transduction histidine kinase
MRRLKLLMLLFCLAISLPLAYVVIQTYRGLEQEERSQLRFFSETLFNEIEADLAQLVQREERRTVDEYHFSGTPESPLSRPPAEPFILGYLQNNPDGSFQTPLVADLGNVPAEQYDLIAAIKADNALFNLKKFSIEPKPPWRKPPPKQPPKAKEGKKAAAGFADRYLSKSAAKPSKSNLGQKTVRREAITAEQALNLAREDEAIVPSVSRRQTDPAAAADATPASQPARPLSEVAAPGAEENAEPVERTAAAVETFQVEVAPMQSVYLRPGRYFVFRRIVINNQIYRQGFLLDTEAFLKDLAASHFDAQPMAQFTKLSLQVMENGQPQNPFESGAAVSVATFAIDRTFPAPFDFLSAALTVSDIPGSPARRALTFALVVLGLIMLLGLVAIYQSARKVVDLSERRSQFVSSVTHELKTPLTNIRMYIEMLEQGIAATPEREQDYLRILGSESVRLSRLINNVLELAKLENKQRYFDMRAARIEDVLAEVGAIMAHKLEQEGFHLTTHAAAVPAFAFDRDVLIQVLINVIENSVKFGRNSPRKEIAITAALEGAMVHIAIADSGPGIPSHLLRKVFDDFYRVDNDLTRTTGGTGIGLALVDKLMTAMGGRVAAANNTGMGCTISLYLPVAPPSAG